MWVITIEDTLELVIRHLNHVRLLYSKDNIGQSQVTAERLLQAYSARFIRVLRDQGKVQAV
jgi:type IV secretory pathway ATPase VirB11/archaellum biosynthesis ATPase